MKCPHCGVEAGSSEFCPGCLAQIGAPALQGEALEQELARKESEALKAQRAEGLRQWRQLFIWAGAIAVAATLGAAIASVIDSLGPAGSAEMAGARPPRVRCRSESDCGNDPCNRPIACVAHVCVRKNLGACTENH